MNDFQQHPQPFIYQPAPVRSSALPWAIATGAVMFAFGAMGAFYFAQQQQAQQGNAIAVLTAQLADMQVTRSQSPDLLAITAPAPMAATLPDIAIEPLETKAEPVSMSIPSASAALAKKAPVAAPDLRSEEDKIADAIAIVSRNKMRMLTEGVVAGLYSVTAEQTDGSGTRIALNSRNAASAAIALQDLLTTAAANGDIQVPDSIATSDGKVDSQTLLFDLVQRSLAGGSAVEVAAAEELRRRAFEASAAQTETVRGQRLYTVRQGDSLAYISLQFYGTPNVYDRIYQANKLAISSPDKIQIGQQLVIPEI